MAVWLVIAAYLLLQLGIGVWASRFVRSEADYLVAGRRLGLAFVTFSLFATWFGAETVMGSSAAVAEQGLAGGRADPFGYTICLLLMGLILARRMRQQEFVTVGDFYRKRYGRSVELLAVAILVPTSVIWAAAQLLAFAQVLSIVTALDVSATLVAATALVIVYTFLGGLLGDVVTDLVQGLVLVVGLALLLGFVLAEAGGPGPALASIEGWQLRFVAAEESLLARLDTWAIPILGSLVAQEALARILAARSPEVARRGSFAAGGVYLLVGLVPVLIALVGTHLAPELGHRDEFLPTMAQQLMPPVLFGVLMGALVSAILSTVDSTLLTIASLTAHTFVEDFLPGLSERARVRLNRGVVVVAGLVAALVATTGGSIYALVETASSFGTAGILVTVVFGLWSRRGGLATAWATILIGAMATHLGPRIPGNEAPFLLAVALALLTFALGATREGRGRRGTVREP